MILLRHFSRDRQERESERDIRSRKPEYQTAVGALTRPIIRATADGIGAITGTENIG